MLYLIKKERKKAPSRIYKLIVELKERA